MDSGLVCQGEAKMLRPGGLGRTVRSCGMANPRSSVRRNSGATPLGTTAMAPPKWPCQVSRAEALTAILPASRS